MREIKAIIQPFMLGDVLHALEGLESLPGVTVSQISGWGKSRAQDAEQVTIEGGHRMARKTKLEVVVPDALVDAVVGAITSAARTGRVGDGKIFITAIEDTVQIRTGEQGEGAGSGGGGARSGTRSRASLRIDSTIIAATSATVSNRSVQRSALTSRRRVASSV